MSGHDLTSKPRLKAPFADNPSQGLIPLSITQLCLNRMIGWASIVNHLVRFLTIVVDQEKKLSESLAKTSKDLSDALTSDSLVLFAEGESLRNMLVNMTEQQASRSTVRATCALNIEAQLLPILKELLGEIKKKATDESKWAPLDKSLQSDLETYTKLTANVRNSLMRQQWKGDTAAFPEISRDCPKDPWLANIALQNHIAECFKKQDSYRRQIIEQEEDFSAFEAVIIQNIKVALATFYEWRNGQFSQQLEQVKFMQQELGRLSPEFDWNIFRRNHDDRFLVTKCEFVQINQVHYDGFDDPGVTIVKQGRLLRKEGVFKRAYKPVTVVLTHSSYFHVYPEILEKNQSFQHVAPELTIDLTECNLVPLMMNEKEPEEIALIVKQGSMFGRESKHKFRGDSMTESAEWWGAMNEQMRKYAGIRNLPTKVPDENDVLEVKAAAVAAVSLSAPELPQSTSKANMTDIPKRPIVNPGSKPGPLPVRSLQSQPMQQPMQPMQQPMQPIQQPIQPTQPSIQPIPLSAPLAPSMPDYSVAEISPEKINLSKLSLTEQMELKLQAQTTSFSAPNMIDIPQFDALPVPIKDPHASSNPWDTFEGDNNPGW